ncbi:MAG: transposase, partial [Candidatus Methylomirabilia bacterium]
MGRRIRFIPEGGSLVEVTCRTIHGRYLMRPSAECRDLILGILARAKNRYQPRLHAFAFLSNHYHLLLWVRDARQLARFMQYLNSNIAREIGRLVSWRDSFWSRRYQAILVSSEEAAQIGRLRYILAQASKEGLVASPLDWPGAHCAKSLLEDDSFGGYWFDRTREFAARQRGVPFGRYDFATLQSACLDPLPCWHGVSPQRRKQYIRELLDGIEQDCGHDRQIRGALEADQIDPHQKPRRFKPSPAPFAHCASKRVRRELWQGYAWFLAAFRNA